MFTGFLFLLFLSGGWTFNSSDLIDNKLQSNQSFGEGESTSDFPNNQYRYEWEENTASLPGETAPMVPRDMDRGYQPRYADAHQCTHRAVLHKVKDMLYNYQMTRPGGDEAPTEVKLDVLLYAILNVNEKDQKFVSYIWVDMVWHEDGIFWDPNLVCGISKIYVPTENLWKPDLTVEEMTEKDKALQTPYLTLTSEGVVIQRNDMMVISTCKMEVYKFPFDVQHCSLTFKSAVHSAKHLKFVQSANSSWNFDWSSQMMTQSEWLFINMTIDSVNLDNFGFHQNKLIYTISMRRRSVLYVANFLLPIIFFLCLDLASFLIPDTSGEKLSFKITVLLAVTVMQLILNEILPCSSNNIPLIAVYCIGIFGLMMVSLLETILVMYLIEKDSQDEQVDEDRSLLDTCICEVKKWSPCGAFVCDVSGDESPSVKEVNSDQLTEESSGLQKVSDELKEVENKVIELLNNTKNKERKQGYWTRVTKTINKVFFVSYIAASALFLIVIFSIWNSPDEEWRFRNRNF